MLEPTHPLAELLRRDKRYRFDAYVFVFDALRYGQEKMNLGQPGSSVDIDPYDDEELEDEPEHHVTGQELCEAIRRYSMEQYGLLAKSVLNHWGITATGDFGEIVFNLIDIGQMRKTDNDRREDFQDVFDFEDAFTSESVFKARESSKESNK